MEEEPELGDYGDDMQLMQVHHDYKQQMRLLKSDIARLKIGARQDRADIDEQRSDFREVLVSVVQRPSIQHCEVLAVRHCAFANSQCAAVGSQRNERFIFRFVLR